MTRLSSWRRCLLLLLTAGISWVAGAGWLDHYGEARTLQGNYDAIVVLGCGVWPSGRASPTLRRRALHAANLWRQGRAPLIVLTGGVGTHPPSEARAAAAVLLQASIPRSAIRLEERSTSTYENAEYAANLLGRDSKVIVVTDAYHVVRAERVFSRRFAVAVAMGSRGTFQVRAYGSLREVIALLAYAVAGRLS